MFEFNLETLKHVVKEVVEEALQPVKETMAQLHAESIAHTDVKFEEISEELHDFKSEMYQFKRETEDHFFRLHEGFDVLSEELRMHRKHLLKHGKEISMLKANQKLMMQT